MRFGARLRAWHRELPWHLRPWHAYRTQRAEIALYRALTGQLERNNAALVRRNEELDARLHRLHGPLERDVIGMQAERMFGYESPGTDQLAFVIAGADRGNGRGVRLYASSQLAAVSFRMTEMDDPPPRFVLRATFGRTDVVDRPDYHQAMWQLDRMWRSRDNAPAL